jgi:adhesin transport system outer membrane protein
LALKVISAYSPWYDSFLKKEAYAKSKKEHDMLNLRLKRRIEQGLSSTSDVKLATSRATQSGTSLYSAIIQHENALRSLEELLGSTTLCNSSCLMCYSKFFSRIF